MQARITAPSPRRRQSGVALVTIIMMVALMSFLIISVLLITSRHRQGAELHSAGLEVRQLSDITVNTVLGQLRQATTHPSDPRRSPAWISQPGAVRTWQGDSPDKLFKLYSSAAMTVDISSPAARSALLGTEAATIAQWQPGPDAPAAVRARFTDLNQPVVKRDVDGDEELHFPIADPRAALDSDPVEGFDYDASAVAGASRNGDQARLPMPVEWFYVLQDGSVGTLDPATLRYTGEGTVSESNPIVGRIAFWTDDESAKINVNTAAEGIPWDTPRADTAQERAYASQPPVANEVQRFPGHPATTSLSPVLFPGRYAGQVVPPGKQALSSDQLRAIYDLAPRVSYTDANGSLAGYLGNNRRAVAFDDQRLYASFDEILFDTERRQNPIPIDRLRRSRFFLTANSRAPEINLFGLPRVALWPVDSRVPNDLSPSDRRTAYDELIAFASTIGVPDGRRYDESGSGLSGIYGKGAYHLLRMAPDSTHFALYGPNNNNSNAQSYRARRNVELVDYLAAVTTMVPPGYTRSLDEKYGNSETFTGNSSVSRRNARAALQNKMGFIRSLNTFDTTRITPTQRVRPYTEELHARNYTAGFHSVQPVGSNTEYQEYRARGANHNVGGPLLAVGRSHAISEVALVFACSAERLPNGTFRGAGGDSSLGNNMKMIDLLILPEWFAPGHGYGMLHYRFRNLLTQFSGTLRFIDEDDNVLNTHVLTHDNFVRSQEHPFDATNPAANIHHEKVLWGGSGGPEWYIAQQGGLNQNHRGFFLIPGQRLPISADATRIELVNIRFRITTREGTHPNLQTNDNRRLQEYRFVFPDTTIPVPNYDPALGSLTNWQSRIARLNEGRPLGTATTPGIHATEGPGGIIRGDDKDVVRSLVVGHGDYRLVNLHVQPGMFGQSTLRYGARSMFVPVEGYHDEELFLAHTLVGSGGHSRRYPGTRLPFDRDLPRGLVPGAAYPEHLQPDFPLLPGEEGYNVAIPANWPFPIDPAVTRDWDNGVGPAPDGAYWNRPDEGARLGATPYFEPLARDFGPEASDDDETFSPNRLLASAVAFGSIPSLPLAYVPWTTFLFRPDLTPGGHFGSASRGRTGSLPGAPPDHAWLDLWWMPVVQPYAISEPYSTAGKVNMNHQILPFTYIDRSTALHAVLKSEEIMAIPTSAGATYKTGAGNASWRHRIDPDETLKQWSERFGNGDVFLTESEICGLFLVPFGQSLNSMPQFWQTHALTGDNTLERPYNNLYPRLTTRSNVFRIHFKVQTITKARSVDADTFDPDTDRVTGEFQGSTLVERYLEPRDPGIPDYADEVRRGNALTNLPSLDRFYRFRVLETRRFAP